MRSANSLTGYPGARQRMEAKERTSLDRLRLRSVSSIRRGNHVMHLGPARARRPDPRTRHLDSTRFAFIASEAGKRPARVFPNLRGWLPDLPQHSAQAERNRTGLPG